MASCLGLYIENNLIKYAKVSKDKDTFKVETYGIKFFEQILLKKIIYGLMNLKVWVRISSLYWIISKPHR